MEEEVKLFAGTRWCLPWCPGLLPHKAGHLGSEFENKRTGCKWFICHKRQSLDCNIRDGDLHRKNPGAFCQRGWQMQRARVHWLWDVKCWFLGLGMVPQSLQALVKPGLCYWSSHDMGTGRLGGMVWTHLPVQKMGNWLQLYVSIASFSSWSLFKRKIDFVTGMFVSPEPTTHIELELQSCTHFFWAL